MKSINSSKSNFLLVSVLFLLCLSSDMASSQPAQGTRITWCSLSPDGQEVVFVKLGKDWENNGLTEIWKVNVDGTNLTQLTKGSVDAAPEWSPDAEEIVFVSWRPEMRLWVMKKDGSKKRQLTRGIQLKHSSFPRWSPKGDTIAFICTAHGRKSLWIINADGTEPRKIVGDIPHRLGWAWSSNGNELLYSSEKGDIWAITLDANNKRLIGSAPSFCIDLRPSPSGDKLMYTASIGNNQDEVGIMNIRGGEEHSGKLILKGNLTSGRWLPNETKVLVNKRVIEGKRCYFHLCIVDVTNGATMELTRGRVNDGFASCLPNGEEILFLRNFESIMIMNMDGSNQRQIFPMT